MKPCKSCNGYGTQGISQNYCKCTDCNGSGIQNDDILTVFIFALAIVVACAVVVVVEVMR